MVVRKLLFWMFVLTAGSASAQDAGFRFGPQLAMGASRFTKMPGMTNGFAFHAGVMASRQITPWFAIQFAPWVGMISSDRHSSLQDGVNPAGRVRVYTFNDRYHAYSVAFPLTAKFSVQVGNHFYFGAFAGPGIAFNMGGTHSKNYDDYTYNLKDGYTAHAMKGLARSMNYGVAGVSLERLTKKNSIIGLDIQVNEFVKPVGQLEGTAYGARSLTIGLCWIK